MEFTGTSRFQIVRQLGAGGMGIVYEALDRDTGEHVALKTLQSLTGASLYRFKNEFRALRGIYHPNLVRLGELHGSGEQWFFTMELVRGHDVLVDVRPRLPLVRETAEMATSVGARIPSFAPAGHDTDVAWSSTAAALEPIGDTTDSNQDLGTRRVANPQESSGVIALDDSMEARIRTHVVQIAEALVQLHSAGKVHRDLKPSNVMVTAEGRVVLLDFGLVLDAFSEAEENTDRNLAGTIAYMAPEQAGDEGIGPAADWYALGVMLYQMITGRLPFVGAAIEVIEDKRAGRCIHARKLVPYAPADLCQLAMDLLAPNPKDRPEGREVLRRLGRRARSASSAPAPAGDRRASLGSQIIGRDDELESLHAMFERTREGLASSVVVTGPSGIGKSALVQAFVEDVRRDHPDVVLMQTRCRPNELVPFQAIDGFVDQLSHVLLKLPDDQIGSLLPPRMRLLVEIFPVLRRVPAIESLSHDRDELPPEQRRLGAFRALRALLAGLATRSPVVLWLEDLHFVDRDSATELAHVIGGEDGPAVLFVATSRSFDEPDDVALQRFGLPPTTRRIELPPLAETAARGLVELLYPSIDTSILPGLLADAVGHPLHVQELVRHARAHGGKRPASLDEILRERVADLDSVSSVTLLAACVAAMPLPEPVLARAAELEIGQIRAAEAPLEAGRLLRVERHDQRVQLEPAHARIIAAVLASHGDEAVRAMRIRLLEALELDPELSGRAELLLPHLRALGRDDEAARRLFEAAELAEARLAFDRAADLLLAAIELAKLDREQERERREAAARCLLWSGRLLPAGEQLERAAMLETRTLDKAELYTRAAEAFATAFEPRGMERTASEAMHLLGRTYPSTRSRLLFGTVVHGLAVLFLPVLALLPHRRDRSRERRMLQALVLAMQIVSYTTSDLLLATYATFGAIYHGALVGPSIERIRSLWMQSIVSLTSGLTWLARNRMMRMKETAASLGDKRATGTAHFCATVILTKLGRNDAAEAEAEQGLAYGPWMDAFDFVGMTTRIGFGLLLLGHVERAILWTRRGLSRAAKDVEDGMLAMSRDTIPTMLAILGRANDGKERYARMLTQDWAHGRVQVGIGAALLYCYEDEVDGTLAEALIRAHQTAAVPPRHPADEQLTQYVFAPYVHMRRAFAGNVRARRDLEASLDSLRVVGKHAWFAAHVPILEAAAAILDGRCDDAQRLLERAEGIARATDSPFATFEAACMRVRCLVRMGFERDARSHLRMALALGEEMHWSGRVARVQRELGQLLDLE